MVNRGTRHAFGVAAFSQAILWGSDQTGRGGAVGIRPRVRFWTSQTTSIDIAPGIDVAGSGAPGFSGHAGLSFADYAGLTMHVAALRPDQFDVDRSTRVAVFAGGRLASVPGTIVGVGGDRKSTRLNSSHGYISYAVFCLKKKKHVIHAVIEVG